MQKDLLGNITYWTNGVKGMPHESFEIDNEKALIGCEYLVNFNSIEELSISYLIDDLGEVANLKIYEAVLPENIRLQMTGKVLKNLLDIEYLEDEYERTLH